jgi:hypothetical protein
MPIVEKCLERLWAYVTHSIRRFAILSSTGRCELVRAPAQRVVRHAAATDGHDAEFFRQEFDFREIVQKGSPAGWSDRP